MEQVKINHMENIKIDPYESEENNSTLTLCIQVFIMTMSTLSLFTDSTQESGILIPLSSQEQFFQDFS